MQSWGVKSRFYAINLLPSPRKTPDLSAFSRDCLFFDKNPIYATPGSPIPPSDFLHFPCIKSCILGLKFLSFWQYKDYGLLRSHPETRIEKSARSKVESRDLDNLAWTV
jgi:hypothetical protein